jgi:ferredoxin--NADP+ reductase
MITLGTEEHPLRVAIVGSGPSGFYAADALFKSSLKVQIDMLDRLPCPYGLVRFGVAPDHPLIKSVTKVFEKIASTPGFSFFGNVKVGRDIFISELKTFYDAIIFACGAETDRKLGIPGEDLPGSYTATEFVAWYNGHPDYRTRQFDLSHETAVVIGQGNVSMDVSRILSKHVDALKNTDITEYALEALSQSKIKHIYLIGRRGPVQAAFTEPEIKEMGKLSHCDVIVDPNDLLLNPESQKELEDPTHTHSQKNFAVLKEYAARTALTKEKQLHICFLQSPVALQGNGKLEKIILEKNALHGKASDQKAKGTGVFKALDCGILFRSVGYRGIPIPELPFDPTKGTFPNHLGRILKDSNVLPGFYAVGWIKRGPSGVIGTNKPDATATVESLLADIPMLTPCKNREMHSLQKLLSERHVRFVNFDEWKQIDAAEIAHGKMKGKTREKFTSVEQMLEVLK